jgi:enoyl-[acyl-carrier protein] reductase I
MIPIDLGGKVALVTGVGNDLSFAWYIAKGLQAAGARIVLACHPRMMNMVSTVLTGTKPEDVEARKLPFVEGDFKPEAEFACDVSYDTMADVPAEVRQDRKWVRIEERHGDYSIEGLVKNLAPYEHIDVLVHSIAYSREIKDKNALNTSRKAYLEALSISSYSLTALVRALHPKLANRPDGAAVLGLTYLGGERVVPHYAGGMSTAKAALEIDAKQLAFNVGREGNIRVNLISAGPYASLAAKGIGDIEKMKAHAAEKSPLPRPITAEEVANAAVFLCSPLASGITGEVLFVDCGYNVMGV